MEPESTKSTLEDESGAAATSRAPAEKPEVRGQSEERDRLMKDLDTRIVVQVGSQSNAGQTNSMISLSEPGLPSDRSCPASRDGESHLLGSPDGLQAESESQ